MKDTKADMIMAELHRQLSDTRMDADHHGHHQHHHMGLRPVPREERPAVIGGCKASVKEVAAKDAFQAFKQELLHRQRCLLPTVDDQDLLRQAWQQRKQHAVGDATWRQLMRDICHVAPSFTAASAWPRSRREDLWREVQARPPQWALCMRRIARRQFQLDSVLYEDFYILPDQNYHHQVMQ
jgi:hypothetical protein